MSLIATPSGAPEELEPETRSPDPTTLLEAARGLAPEITSRADEIEANGTLPRDLVEQLRAAGLLSMALPRGLGGAGADARTVVEVVEALAHADASTGWTVLIAQNCGFLGWVDPATGREIVRGAPRPVIAGSMAPTGWGVATPGVGANGQPGYLLSGRWSTNSGCRHADYIQVAFFIRDGDRPRIGPNGQPVMRFALVPASAAQVLPTWDVMGLRGTGSDDLVIEGAQVPHTWTFDPVLGTAEHPGGLYQLSFFSYLMTMMAGFPLGVTARALDEFRAIAHGKSRLGTRHSLAADPMIQVRLLRATSQLRAARLLVMDAVTTCWEQAERGPVDPVARADLAAAVQHAQRVAASTVEWAFHACGGSAVYATHPLQRCWRDICAAGQHIAFGADIERRTARVDLGLETELLHLV